MLLKSSEWSLIEYEDLQGYIASDSAEFRLLAGESTDEPGSSEFFEDDTTETALISPHEGKTTPVYESADESSAVLGSLKPDVEVAVIQTVDGWSLIELQGHQVYVKEIDLKFTAQL